MYYAYVLYSYKDKKLYIGFTSDLKRRINEHKNGQARSTRYRGKLQLIYYEAFLSKTDALYREKYYKTGWGRNYIKRLLSTSLKEMKNY